MCRRNVVPVCHRIIFSLSLLSLVGVAHCSMRVLLQDSRGDAPAVEADGAALLLAAGDGGSVDMTGEDVTFAVGVGSAAQQVSVLDIMTMLSTLQDKVTTLTTDVATLTDELANCKTSTDDWRLSAAAKLEQLPVLENSININTASAKTLAGSIASLEKVQADGEDGIQFELSALAKKLSALTNETNPTCAALGTYDANLAVHDSVLATDHVVGFVFTMRCDDGWYPPAGDVDLTCFPSGNYCPAHLFPFAECGKQVALPVCKACPEGCATCTSATKCTACVAGKDLFLSRSGQCVKHLDCKGYQLAGMLKKGVNDFVSLGLEVVLKNGKTSKNTKCLVDEDDNLYEVIPCTDFTDGSACVAASTYGLTATSVPVKGNSPNTTCADNGYMLFTFRNKAHYELMYKAYGVLQLRTWVRAVPVTLKTVNPWRHYPRVVQPFAGCAMKSDGSAKTACNSGQFWGVPDGGDWWLSDLPNREPNGCTRSCSQQTGWFLRTTGFTATSLAFNDERGASSTGINYLCIQRTD